MVHIIKRRRAVVAGLLMAGLALASGTPAWGPNGNGLKNAKSGRKGNKGAPGHEDLGSDDLIDFDAVSPKDCADFLCVTSSEKATDYIEAGCPGQFATFNPENDYDYDQEMESLIGYSSPG